MRTLVAILLLTVAGCANSPQQDEAPATADQREKCAAGGGCFLVTRDQLQAVLRKGADLGAKACRQSL
jgi:hypothetical protein